MARTPSRSALLREPAKLTPAWWPRSLPCFPRSGAERHVREALTGVARELVFARDGFRCLRCKSGGGKAGLEWSHIRSRRFLNTRWRLENAFAACPRCHRWWHDHPHLSGRWLEEVRPGWVERVEQLAAELPIPKRVDDFKDIAVYLARETRRLTHIPGLDYGPTEF